MTAIYRFYQRITQSLPVSIFILALFSTSPLAAGVPQPFEIQSQMLSDALISFSRAANIQFLSTDVNITKIGTNGVSGNYTPEEALDILFQDTGYTFEFISPDTIRIFDQYPEVLLDSERKVYYADAGQSASSDKQPSSTSNTSPPGSPITPSTSPVVGLEEVIVTARKRQENLQSVASAVSAFTGEALNRMGANNIERVGLLTPGFEYGQFGLGTRLTIRGQGPPEFSANNQSPTAVYVDGVYMSRGAQAFMAFADVERVEVLRGPQGTLYGRNTIGGGINIITNKPHSEFEAFGKVTLGKFDRIQSSGTVNLPINKKVQVRASFMQEKHDGYVKNSNPAGDDLLDEDQIMFRGSLRFLPNDDIDIVVSGHWWDQGGDGYGFAASKFRSGVGILPAGFNNVAQFWELAFCQPIIGLPAGVCAPGFDPAADLEGSKDPYEINQDSDAVRDVQSWGINATATWDLGAVQLTSITAFTSYDQFTSGDSDFTALPVWVIQQETNVETFSQEIQLSSTTDGPLSWTLGVFYLDDEIVEDLFSELISVNIPINDRFAVFKVKSIAGFGEASYFIRPDIRITGGVRYTEDDNSYRQTVDPSVGPKAPQGNIDLSKTFSEMTWRAGIDYFFQKDIMIYFNASKGFKSGTFNRFSGDPLGRPLVVQPEIMRNYEFGLKATFFERRLQVNIAGFFNNIDDLHSYGFDNINQTSVISNAGEASTQGIEVEISTLPLPNLRWGLNVAWLDARFDKFEDFSDGSTRNALDVSGNKRPLSPEWTLSSTASYDFHTEYGTFSPYVQFSWKDNYFATPLNATGLDSQDSLHMTDVRLQWESPGGHWNAEAYVENIENEGRLLGGFMAFGGFFATEGPQPRIYGFSVGYRY